MTVSRVLKPVLTLAVLAGLAGAGYVTRDQWQPYLFPTKQEAHEDDDHAHASPPERVTLSEQARKNLRLTSKPLVPQTHWKTISVPGIIIDRPGFGDRGIVAPATGIVSRFHRVAGETVKPGEPLVTLKLLSETLHLTQTELFKATQDVKLAEEQKKRLASAGGGVAEARVIEVDNQITRLQVAIKAYRQELLNRGIVAAQIDAVTQGTFVSELVIPAPGLPTGKAATPFEIQDVKVELGQQVQAGQTLCLLSNHQLLSVEGRAFRDESPLLERAVKEGWPVEVDFDEADARDWPTVGKAFPIAYIANTIDPDSRTFRFLLPLENQSRTVERDGRAQLLWRFRPGQRVRLNVRVEAIPDVFVLPAAAVAREGADAYVFRQNGDTFDRKPVQVVDRTRDVVVIANDGSVPPGIYVAQAAAAQLNRMLKTQTSAVPAGFHVHADGTVHEKH